MGMAVANIATLFLAARNSERARQLYSIQLDSKEKELLQIFQQNTEKTSIDKNEYLLFNLVKKKKVDINLIQEIWKEFDALDTNAMGMITYEDIEGKVKKRHNVVRFDLEQGGGGACQTPDSPLFLGFI
jgi:hypothetical protein